MRIELQLPLPWKTGTNYVIDDLSPITWLVGPNGAGKSRFLRALRDHGGLSALSPRLVSTDRLAAARPDESMRALWGDRTVGGLQKSYFPQFITANHRDGAIVGTVTLLHHRSDLRLRVEATLSQLLERHIKLEMTDGNLTPKVRSGTSAEYSMLSDECHGVLELLVLLANIYDDDTQLLLIDEPEQNLHPQYQAFVLDELRRSGKRAVMATHSPSFLSVKTVADLQGVICFHADFSPPSMYRAADHIDRDVQEVLPRMTEQHRTFFFASRPVFVEGYFDMVVVTSIQRALGLTSEAAGSCVIPCLGKDDAGRYLTLCKALGKRAVFMFDLDVLFDRCLRRGAAQNSELAERIAASGHGRYDDLIGQLLRAIDQALYTLDNLPPAQIPPTLQSLTAYLKENIDTPNKRRLAVLVCLADQMAELKQILGSVVDTVSGFHRAVLQHLGTAEIHVLPGGALENYLPSYTGNRFKVPDDSKRASVLEEQSWLGEKRDRSELLRRYRDLAKIVEQLPSRPQVDIRPKLLHEVADLLHNLIVAIRSGQVTHGEQAGVVLGESWRRVSSFIEIAELEVRSKTDFNGSLKILDRFGIGLKHCRFDHRTQSNDAETLRLEPESDAPRESSTPAGAIGMSNAISTPIS